MSDIADDRFVLNEEALDELYAWIDTIPLSRPKKNIARDFSDGVLVAETVAHFLPKMVDMHNYFTASAAGQKKINWNTLNRRVFNKMGIRVSEATIQLLIEAKPGAIEQVLWDLRRKITEQMSGVMVNSHSRPVSVSRARSPATYVRNAALGGNAGSNNQTVAQQQQLQARVDIAYDSCKAELDTNKSVTAPGGVAGLTPATAAPNTPPLTFSQTQQLGYVVPPSIHHDETSNNNTAFGPPTQIIYRGYKMVPSLLIEEKQREIKAYEAEVKILNTKVIRIDNLIQVKDQRIEDLTHQLHSLRAIYERVTQQTWQGFQ